MEGEKPEKPAFDVAVLGAPTDDGEGRRVLRVQPGKAQIGEVRPVKEGKALLPGAEVVAMKPREDAPWLHDVDVKYAAPPPPEPASVAHKGPPQVATKAYRDSWERIFGSREPTSTDVN